LPASASLFPLEFVEISGQFSSSFGLELVVVVELHVSNFLEEGFGGWYWA